MINLSLKNQEVCVYSSYSLILNSQFMYVSLIWYQEKNYVYNYGGYDYYVRKHPENGRKEVLKDMYRATWPPKSRRVLTVDRASARLIEKQKDKKDKKEQDKKEQDKKERAKKEST